MSQTIPLSQTVVAMKQIGVNMLQTDFEEEFKLCGKKILNVSSQIFFSLCIYICPNMWHTCILCFAGKSIISNDGATILKNLDIVHPAAKTLVDIAKSQDAEVSKFTSLNFLNLHFFD